MFTILECGHIYKFDDPLLLEQHFECSLAPPPPPQTISNRYKKPKYTINKLKQHYHVSTNKEQQCDPPRFYKCFILYYSNNNFTMIFENPSYLWGVRWQFKPPSSPKANLVARQTWLNLTRTLTSKRYMEIIFPCCIFKCYIFVVSCIKCSLSLPLCTYSLTILCVSTNSCEG